jgi:hypothetical protein
MNGKSIAGVLPPLVILLIALGMSLEGADASIMSSSVTQYQVTFTDAGAISGKTVTATHGTGGTGSPAIDTSVLDPWGGHGGVGKFVAANLQYLSLADSDDWWLSTTSNGAPTDFTIDFRIMFNSLPASGSGGYEMLMGQYQDGNNLWYVRVMEGVPSAGQYGLQIWFDNAGIYGGPYAGLGALTTGVWYHFAITCHSNYIYFWLNGVNKPTNWISAFAFNNLSGGLGVGGFVSNQHYLDGWLAEFRISKGIARWTDAAGGFTLPTAPYTADSNTVLLLQMSGTNGSTSFPDDVGTGTNTVVTVAGNAVYQSQLPYTAWYDSGTSLTYAFASSVNGFAGTRYVWSSTGGLDTLQGDTFTVTGSGTVTGTYIVQYEVTFTSSGIGGDTSGTVVTVAGSAKTQAQLPFTAWYNGGASVSYSFTSPISATGGKQYAWSTTSTSPSGFLQQWESGSITASRSYTFTGMYTDPPQSDTIVGTAYGMPYGEYQPWNGAANPDAYYYNGVTYVVWQSTNMDVYIASYASATGTWSGPVFAGHSPLWGSAGVGSTSPDHGSPAIMVDNNGYIHIMYGCDPGYPIQHVRSTNPEDIMAWTTMPDPIPTPGAAVGSTYLNFIKDSTGNLYVVYLADKLYVEDMIKSTDGGTTWSAPRDLINLYTGNPGDWIYVLSGTRYDAATNRIHLTWVMKNGTESTLLGVNFRQNLYYAYLNLNDNNMYSVDGTNLGTTINFAQATAHCMIVDSFPFGTDEAVVRVDSTGKPYIIYQAQLKSSTNWNNGWEYNFTRWTGTSWSVPVGIRTSGNLDGNVFFVHSSTNIEAYLVNPSASSIEQWSWNGSTWTKVSTVLADSHWPLEFPMEVVNGVDYRIVFCEVNRSGTGTWTISNLRVFACDPSSPLIVKRRS